jgi:hypothetical protein
MSHRLPVDLGRRPFVFARQFSICDSKRRPHSTCVDRLRLALDAELAAAMIGTDAPLAHPAPVCDVAIGQSTLVTQRVKANLSTAA